MWDCTRGEVVYGNIGTPGRRTTVIGEAVNRVARVESLTAPSVKFVGHR